MAEAGRLYGNAQAYVALSPGSFSDESIDAIDSSGIPWLFIASRDERHLHDIVASLREKSHSVRAVDGSGDRARQPPSRNASEPGRAYRRNPSGDRGLRAYAASFLVNDGVTIASSSLLGLHFASPCRQTHHTFTTAC